MNVKFKTTRFKHPIIKMEKIWKDRLLGWYFSLLVILVSSIGLFILLIYFPLSYSNNKLIRIAGFALVGLFVWLFYSLARLRFNYIQKDGIRVGNVYYKNHKDIFLKQEPIFIPWRSIKKIKLVSKVYLGSVYGSSLHNFLIADTQNNKRYECAIYDYMGFIESIKKLGKSCLFAKDSKYTHISKIKSDNQWGIKIWLAYNIIITVGLTVTFIIDLFIDSNIFNSLYGLPKLISYAIPILVTLLGFVIILSYWFNRKVMYFCSLLYCLFAIMLSIIFIFMSSKIVINVINIIVFSLVGHSIYKEKNQLFRRKMGGESNHDVNQKNA